MSLIKQLWIAIVVLMILAFGGSFLVSTYSGKAYLEDQLRLKDLDTATSLALSLSQLEKDPVTIELMLAAQFDTGHFEQIRLLNPNGMPMVEKVYRGDSEQEAPAWFHHWMALDLQPAQALVQDGWQQYGTLIIESQSGYALDRLWEGTIRLLQWFLFLGVASGILGTLFLRSVSRPLDGIVLQAEAIGDRRFIRSSEPRTLEFRRLVVAMNRLSDQVRDMLAREAEQLDQMRRKLQTDDVTGLSNREHFFNLLQSRLNDQEYGASGALMMVRLLSLQNINTQLGRKATDELIQRMAAVLTDITQALDECRAGRLNGSDFAILVPGRYDPEAIASSIRSSLDQIINDISELPISLPMAVCGFDEHANRGQLMAQLDGALSQAEQQGRYGRVDTQLQASEIRHTTLDEWREVLDAALNDGGAAISDYPVCWFTGALLHKEAPARLEIDGAWRPARYFVPWVARLGLLPRLDSQVTSRALEALAKTPESGKVLAVNVSAEAIIDPTFRQELMQKLKAAGPTARRLALECHESCAVRHPAEFRAWCSELHSVGCQVGLERVGTEFSHIPNLQNLGLDYVKVDSALIHNLHQEPGNQAFVRSLCSIGHALGIIMIAQGVTSQEEKDATQSVGLDAVTGQAVTYADGDQ